MQEESDATADEIHCRLPSERYCFRLSSHAGQHASSPGEPRSPSPPLSPVVSPRGSAPQLGSSPPTSDGINVVDSASVASLLAANFVCVIACESEKDRAEWLSSIQHVIESQRATEDGSPAAQESFSFSTRATIILHRDLAAACEPTLTNPVTTEREKLLLGYRFIKSELLKQANPAVIYVPPNEIYRRFGYGMCLKKLLKQNPQVHQIQFVSCWFMCDFFEELLEQLALYPQLNSIVFDNAPPSAAATATNAAAAAAASSSSATAPASGSAATSAAQSPSNLTAPGMLLPTSSGTSTEMLSAPSTMLYSSASFAAAAAPGVQGGGALTPHSTAPTTSSYQCDELAFQIAARVPPTVTSMAFIGNLTPVGVQAVLDAVASNAHIESLSLSHNSLGPIKSPAQADLLVQCVASINRSNTLRRLVRRLPRSSRPL